MSRLKLILPYVSKFVSQIAILPQVKEIYLFGSFASGVSSKISDIDVFVLVNNIKIKRKIQAIASEVSSEIRNENLRHVLSISVDTKLDPNLLQQSIALWKRVSFVETKPVAIIQYDISGLKSPQKSKISRIIHGYVTKKKVGKKVYTSKSKGILEELKAKKIRDAIMVDQGHQEEVVTILEKLGAKVKVLIGEIQG